MKSLAGEESLAISLHQQVVCDQSNLILEYKPGIIGSRKRASLLCKMWIGNVTGLRTRTG